MLGSFSPKGRRHKHHFALLTSPVVGSGKIHGSCSFAVNLRLAFGLMATGSGPYKIRKQFGHLDIPVSGAWVKKGLHACMQSIGSSIEERAKISCETALADELILTLEKISFSASVRVLLS